MNKEKLNATVIAEQLAEDMSLNKRTAEDFIKALISTIEEGLLVKDVVKLKGLGTFKLQWNVPRKSVDVNTGDEIVIDGYHKVVFKPENKLKELVNEPYAHLESVSLSEEIEAVLPSNEVDAADSIAPLKLFNEQVSEIKGIISEINALNKPVECPSEPKESLPLQQTVQESKKKHSPPSSDEFQKKTSTSSLKNRSNDKSKRNNRKTIDFIFIAGMIGGLLIYILVDFNALSFFSDFAKSNKMTTSSTYYAPQLATAVLADTILSDTLSIVDSVDVVAAELTKEEPVDILQSLFDQPRVYKEFIATEEVIPGSRLTRIAERHYGVKEFWVYIYEANMDQFSSPDKVTTGMILKIPKLNPVLADKDNPKCMEYALHLHDFYLKK